MDLRKIGIITAVILCFFLFMNFSFASTVDVTEDGEFRDIEEVIDDNPTDTYIYLNNHTFVAEGQQLSIDKDNITIDGSINPDRGGNGDEMSTIDADSLSRVMEIRSDSVILKNLIITNGFIGIYEDDARGAAALIRGTDITFINCIIMNCEVLSNQAQATATIHIASSNSCIVNLINSTLCNNRVNTTGLDTSEGSTSRVAYLRGSMINCNIYDNYVYSAHGTAVGVSFYPDSYRNTIENSLFENNIVETVDGQAYGGALQLYGDCTNCTFINNHAHSGNSGSHAGALCFRPDSTVDNCTFIGNHADKGGATSFHASGELTNSIFINNTALTWGGAITTDDTPGQYITIENCYFEGNRANNGGAVSTRGSRITFTNNTFISNSANTNGGAFNIEDNGVVVINSTFINNTAKDHGGAGFISGNNVEIYNSTFENNSAFHAGAIGVIGNNIDIDNSNFTSNNAFASSETFAQAGALGIIGDNTTVKNSIFFNNTVEGNGGAIYVLGDNLNVIDSLFRYNHANPYPAIDLSNGHGGAVYTLGDGDTYTNTDFRYNNAVNGSAIYTQAYETILTNVTFFRNQAYTYALPITVEDSKNKYGVAVNVTAVLEGGNNIANAIYNLGNPEDIYFYNVTYMTNINGVVQNKTTTDNEIHPVLGAENSENGALLYQDSRENCQLIDVVVENAETGEIIYEENHFLTDIYGDISFSLEGLEPGNYIVKVNHYEDFFYKSISNETLFEVLNLVDLEINLESNVSAVIMGDTIKFIVTITNNGPHDDKNVNTTIDLGEFLDYLSSNSDKGTYNPNTGVWTIGDLNVGETITLEIIATPNTVAEITASSEAINGSEDSNLANNFASLAVDVIDYTINKDVNDTNPNWGDEIEYAVTVENIGSASSSNVVVTDVLPDGVEFVSASNGGIYDEESRTITWILNLNSHETQRLTVNVKVNVYGSLTNVVSVNNKTANVTVIVPEIAIDKTVNDTNPNLNDNVEYTISVENKADVNAEYVTVTDVLPVGVEFVGASNGGFYNPDSRTITWILDISAQGTVDLTVDVKVLSYGDLTNVASVNNVTDKVTVTVTEIAIDKAVNDTNPNLGDDVEYTIVVENTADVDAEGVVVVDTLPVGVEFVSASNGGVYDLDTRTITWILDMASGETVRLTVNVKVNVYGSLTNVVTVNDKTAYVTVTVPKIAIDKTVNDTNPNLGDNLGYAITVENTADVDAEYVTVTDVLPVGVEFVSASNGGVYDTETNTVTWILDMASGETVRLTVNVKVLSYGNLTNVVTVNNVTDDVTVTVPEIAIDKSVNDTNPNLGDDVEYTITVENTAGVDAENIIVQDVLPDGVEFVSASNGGVYDSETNTITWILDISSKEIISLTVNVKVIVYGSLTNVVVVNDKTDNVTVTVPEIAIDKTVNDTNPNLGDNLGYIITVENTADVDAEGVVVVDTLPVGVEFVGASNGGVYDPDSRTITWILDISAQGTVDLTVDVKVLSYGNLTNVVTVNNKTDNVTVTVPEIAIDKTVNDTNPNLGDNLGYTITVENTADVDAEYVTVIDVLPVGVEFISASNGGVYDEDTRTITWILNLNSLETQRLTVNVKILSYGNLTNVVSVNNKTANVTVTVPEINIDKVANASDFTVGDEISYTIVVENTADVNADNIIVQDVLPEGFEFISASNGGVYDENNRIVTWILNIASKGTLNLTVDIKTIAAGNLTNIVVVNDKKDNVTVNVKEPIADLEITIIDNKTDSSGNVIFTIKVVNNGPDTAYNCTSVGLFLPSGEIIAFNITKGNFDSESLIWSIPKLDVDEEVYMEIVCKFNINSGLDYAVNITSDVFDPVLENNYDNISISAIPDVDPETPENITSDDDEDSVNDVVDESADSYENILTKSSVGMLKTGNPILLAILMVLVLVGSCIMRKD